MVDHQMSCCGEYEWCAEAGQYYVLRYTPTRGYEEFGRGLYRDARKIWDALTERHMHKAARGLETRQACCRAPSNL